MTAMIDQEAAAAPVHESLEELGTYESLREAGAVVDRLSATGVPVDDLRIVGADLRIAGRPGGRPTVMRAAGLGGLSGLWFGLLLGLLFSLFTPVLLPVAVLGPILLFAFGGAVFGVVGSIAAEGLRDVGTVERVLARRFTVLVTGPRAAQAREVLGS